MVQHNAETALAENMTAEKIDGCINLSVVQITEEPTQAESEELSVKLGRWPLNGRLTPDESITRGGVAFAFIVPAFRCCESNIMFWRQLVTCIGRFQTQKNIVLFSATI